MRKFKFFLLFCLPALAHGETWMIDDRNGCKVLNPDPLPNESVQWSGACKNGYAEGEGTQQWFDNGVPGQKYIGSMSGGKRSGSGVYIWPDGMRFDGEFFNNKRNGFGKMVIPRGSSKIDKASKLGVWIGDEYIMQGLFEDGIFKLSCNSKKECLRLAAQNSAKKRRENEDRERQEAYERANACKRHYVGKVVALKGGMGLTFEGEVKGVGSTMMTVRYNFLGDWKSAEFPCADYP